MTRDAETLDGFAADGLPTPADPLTESRAETRPRSVRARFLRNKGAMAGLGWLCLVAIAAIAAPLVAPYDPSDQNLLERFEPPSWEHLLGTDDLGRDILSRLIYGARISLGVSFGAVGLALLLAVPVGLIAGYLGGRLDNILMRLNDAGLAFPPLVLALAVAGVLGPGLVNVTLALCVVFAPVFARLVRGQALAVSEETFVEASRSIGTPTRVVLARRVFPNVTSPVVIQCALVLGAALIAEAGLSFLGLGAQPPTASWGLMLREAYDSALFTHGWQLFIPGATIALTVIAFNAIGDGLRDARGFGGAGSRRRIGRRTPTAEKASMGITRAARRPTAATATTGALLEIDGLSVDLVHEAGVTSIVDEVNLVIDDGKVMGLVGESGSGKTVTALSIMRLLSSPPWRISGGRIGFAGTDLLGLDFAQLRRIRGNQISMVFQDPLTTLNPAFTVGDQIIEAVRLHDNISRPGARARARDLLAQVGVSDPSRNLRAYPHQFSGGMRQRATIAMALAGRPRLLIADEPTTALDVTIQAQILELLRSLAREMGLAVLFVTHDLGVVGELCDDVSVMYAGQIVESGHTSDVFASPRHPYTSGLFAAAPQRDAPQGELFVIPGRVPAPGQLPTGCRFHPRCPHATVDCTNTVVDMELLGDRSVRCLRHDELNLASVG